MRTTKNIAQTIRTELKNEFPNCKFSVTSTYNSINIALMSAPLYPFAREVTSHGDKLKGYAQLNRYYIQQDCDGNWLSNGVYLTAAAAQMLLKVIKIALREHYDRSDIQHDYFDTNYYLGLSIGRNKPFVLKAQSIQVGARMLYHAQWRAP